MMERLFCSYIKERIDFFVSLFRGIRCYYANTIHHSVYMGIYSNIWHIIEHGQNDFRSFYSYSRKGLEKCEVIWNNAIVFLSENSSGLFDKTGFVFEKIYILEVSFDFLKRESNDIMRFTYFLEKWRGDTIDLFICCLG